MTDGSGHGRHDRANSGCAIREDKRRVDVDGFCLRHARFLEDALDDTGFREGERRRTSSWRRWQQREYARQNGGEQIAVALPAPYEHRNRAAASADPSRFAESLNDIAGELE